MHARLWGSSEDDAARKEVRRESTAAADRAGCFGDAGASAVAPAYWIFGLSRRVGGDCHGHRRYFRPKAICRTDDDEACRHMHPGGTGRADGQNKPAKIGLAVATECHAFGRRCRMHLQRTIVGFLHRHDELPRSGSGSTQAVVEIMSVSLATQ